MRNFHFNRKSNRRWIAALGLSVSLLFSGSLLSETSPLPSSTDTQSMQMPHNGQKMEVVEAQYGAPLKRVSPVGEPPISRWVYADFTVYFEENLVLHSVVHKS